jgi:transposase InsO family protein
LSEHGLPHRIWGLHTRLWCTRQSDELLLGGTPALSTNSINAQKQPAPPVPFTWLSSRWTLRAYIASPNVPRLDILNRPDFPGGLFGGPWRSIDAVEFPTLDWVDWFNNRRLLEPIGNVPPAEFERAYYRRQEAHALAA